MDQCSFFVGQNVGVLEQGIDLLASIDDETYVMNGHLYFGSGIGRHFRHILDHYQCMLCRTEKRIDYDARERDERLETDRKFSMVAAEGIVEELKGLGQTEPPLVAATSLHVNSNEGENPEKVSPWTGSTLERELQYLLSHTVHHYALIAMMLKILGKTPPKDFGVAPSTIQYERSLEKRSSASM